MHQLQASNEREWLVALPGAAIEIHGGRPNKAVVVVPKMGGYAWTQHLALFAWVSASSLAGW